MQLFYEAQPPPVWKYPVAVAVYFQNPTVQKFQLKHKEQIVLQI